MAIFEKPPAGAIRTTAPRVALVAAAAMLFMAARCEGDVRVAAVEDWGGGPASPYVPGGYALAFGDDFDQLREAGVVAPGTAVDGDAHGGWESYFRGWGVRHLEGNNDRALKADASYAGRGGPSLGDHGIQLRALTGEGTLKLYGLPTPARLKAQFDMPYLAGMISGERLLAQRYGYWEVRLRFNTLSAGQHWAVWLIPSDHSWPPEIDMLETVGSNPENQSDADHFMFNSILSEDNDDLYTRVVPPRGRHAWYTIGFLSDETGMRWYLDGQEVRSRARLEAEKELYIVISPEIGDQWTGPPTAQTAWPAEAEIDYIRIYQAEPAGG